MVAAGNRYLQKHFLLLILLYRVRIQKLSYFRLWNQTLAFPKELQSSEFIANQNNLHLKKFNSGLIIFTLTCAAFCWSLERKSRYTETIISLLGFILISEGIVLEWKYKTYSGISRNSASCFRIASEVGKRLDFHLL